MLLFIWSNNSTFQKNCLTIAEAEAVTQVTPLKLGKPLANLHDSAVLEIHHNRKYENTVKSRQKCLQSWTICCECTFESLGTRIFESGLSRVQSSSLETVKLMCSRLTFLDVHPALSILRSSLSSPKFQYLSGFLHDNQLLEVYCFSDQR